MSVMDSTGYPVDIGDKVRFRDRIYTIKEFLPGEGRGGTAVIKFHEKQHVGEVADEWSIDKIGRAWGT